MLDAAPVKIGPTELDVAETPSGAEGLGVAVPLGIIEVVQAVCEPVLLAPDGTDPDGTDPMLVLVLPVGP